MRAFFLMSLLAFAPLVADNNKNHVLTVTGEGQTTVKAGIADIQMGIEVQRKTANDTQQDLASKLKPVLEKLKALNADKLETGTMQILPEYDKNNPQKMVGYKGLVNVQFSTDAANAGSLIDAAIGAGANELNSVTLSPSEDILKGARLKALELACHNATEKAATILKTLKLENKGITQVTAEQHSPGPYARNYSYATMAKAAPALEVSEQEQLITAHIQLQIKID